MIKPSDPKQLAIDLMARSTCSVQVAAVICSPDGHIHSWGWNHVGRGFGCHAEDHAISRANMNHIWYGEIYVASQRKRNKKAVNSKPCEECRKIISKRQLDIFYRGADGAWRTAE